MLIRTPPQRGVGNLWQKLQIPFLNITQSVCTPGKLYFHKLSFQDALSPHARQNFHSRLLTRGGGGHLQYVE